MIKAWFELLQVEFFLLFFFKLCEFNLMFLSQPMKLQFKNLGILNLEDTMQWSDLV